MLLWGAYVKYPLPTECGTCAMATGISEKMGGPHDKDSLTPWTQTTPQTSSHVCPFCSKSHNSRDSLVNHIWFHYWMVQSVVVADQTSGGQSKDMLNLGNCTAGGLICH